MTLLTVRYCEVTTLKLCKMLVFFFEQLQTGADLHLHAVLKLFLTAGVNSVINFVTSCCSRSIFTTFYS